MTNFGLQSIIAYLSTHTTSIFIIILLLVLLYKTRKLEKCVDEQIKIEMLKQEQKNAQRNFQRNRRYFIEQNRDNISESESELEFFPTTEASTGLTSTGPTVYSKAESSRVKTPRVETSSEPKVVSGPKVVSEPKVVS